MGLTLKIKPDIVCQWNTEWLAKRKDCVARKE